MIRRAEVIKYLTAGARAADARQKAIAANLANVETPAYRRQDVKFEQALQKAIDSGRPLEFKAVQPELHRPKTTPVDADGNDVDLEIEVGALMSNSGRYRTTLKLLNKMYAQMASAIDGQGK